MEIWQLRVDEVRPVGGAGECKRDGIGCSVPIDLAIVMRDVDAGDGQVVRLLLIKEQTQNRRKG